MDYMHEGEEYVDLTKVPSLPYDYHVFTGEDVGPSPNSIPIDDDMSEDMHSVRNSSSNYHMRPSSVIEWGLYPSFWNVVPVFVKMLLEAPRAAKHLPGCVLLQGHKPVRRVELCGTITEVVVRAAYAEGKIEDATGCLNLRFTVDEDEMIYGPQTSEDIQTLRSTIKQGAQVILSGKLNEYKDQLEVLVDYCHLVKSPEEARLFEECVSRVHSLDPTRFPQEEGFTVPEDARLFECMISDDPSIQEPHPAPTNQLGPAQPQPPSMFYEGNPYPSRSSLHASDPFPHARSYPVHPTSAALVPPRSFQGVSAAAAFKPVPTHPTISLGLEEDPLVLEKRRKEQGGSGERRERPSSSGSQRLVGAGGTLLDAGGGTPAAGTGYAALFGTAAGRGSLGVAAPTTAGGYGGTSGFGLARQGSSGYQPPAAQTVTGRGGSDHMYSGGQAPTAQTVTGARGPVRPVGSARLEFEKALEALNRGGM